MEMLRNAIVTLVVSIVAALASWAYTTNEMVTQHEANMKVLISESGGVRPSIEALLLEERLQNHLNTHKEFYDE